MYRFPPVKRNTERRKILAQALKQEEIEDSRLSLLFRLTAAGKGQGWLSLLLRLTRTRKSQRWLSLLFGSNRVQGKGQGWLTQTEAVALHFPWLGKLIEFPKVAFAFVFQQRVIASCGSRGESHCALVRLKSGQFYESTRFGPRLVWLG